MAGVVRSGARWVATVALAVSLAACSTLPRSGPDDQVIARNASAALVDDSGTAPSYQYAIVDVTKSVLPYVTTENAGSIYSTFGGGRGPAPQILVGVGDVVQVTVFESQAGGLFIPADAGARPGNFVTFPQQTVDRRGFITVPYAGAVRAVGRATTNIEAEIVSRLLEKAIEPQVTVTIVERNATNATVVGEVNAPNRLSISESGDRVLDMISRAGGLKYDDFESFVTLTRRGKKGTVFFPNLVRKSSENIYVAPDDTIYVYREQRRFIAFGASGLTGEFNFEREKLYLTEAVARAGGLLDSRADPAQVLLYRPEDRRALEKMGVDLTDVDYDLNPVPTIYRFNFRKPDSYFLASNFPMRDGDVIYVSNADAVELIKFLDVLNSVTSTAAGVSGDINATKENVRAIGH